MLSLHRVALSQRVAQAGAFTKGSVPSPCRQGAEEEAFGNFGNDFASKGHTDILTYYTTLRIQYIIQSYSTCVLPLHLAYLALQVLQCKLPCSWQLPLWTQRQRS